MATSPEFNVILQVIETKPLKAFKATWKDGTERTLWPLVLGTSPAGGSGPPAEKVLCYEFVAANPSTRIFRCFKVENLTGPVAIDWPTPPLPKGLQFKQVRSQNCVEDVEAYRPFRG